MAKSVLLLSMKETPYIHGLVVKSTGSWYKVLTDDGKEVDCRVRGKFRIRGIKSTNPVAVGDRVKISMEGQTGIIQEIEPRKNYIPRRSVKQSKRIHIIAANIDRVFLLVTIRFPRTFTAFIDRFLATAEAYDLETVLVFNKMDKYGEADLEVLNSWKEVYEKTGYTCLETSAVDGRGLESLKELMKDRVSLFAGHSGTGKSSLINRLEPGLKLRTKALTRREQQGAHTTTYAEMHTLSFGGYIIDTPGIKGFGVVDFSEEETGDYFREIFALKSQCRYHNCRHLNEPGCAVIRAVENGDIAVFRYLNYVDLLTEKEDKYR